MKKQDNHKKPRKFMDQVCDVMRLNCNRECLPRILSKRMRGYREFQLELVKTIHERDLKYDKMNSIFADLFCSTAIGTSQYKDNLIG
jgi:hypothetical protein